MGRRLFEEMRIFNGILMEYGQLYGGKPHSCEHIFPHSYLISSVIRFVKFLRYTLEGRLNPGDAKKPVDFFEESKDFWTTMFGEHPLYYPSDVGLGDIDPEFKISWVDLAKSDINPRNTFSLLVLNEGRQFVRSFHSGQTWNPRPDSLVRDLQMPSPERSNLRTTILLISGIAEMECQGESDLRGPLDELKAGNLVAGPFKLNLTRNPFEHLTFIGTHSKTTVLLLDTESMFNLYPLQRIGLATYVNGVAAS